MKVERKRLSIFFGRNFFFFFCLKCEIIYNIYKVHTKKKFNEKVIKNLSISKKKIYYPIHKFYSQIISKQEQNEKTQLIQHHYRKDEKSDHFFCGDKSG